MLASIFFIFSGLVSLSAAGYMLEDDYEPSVFFSMFDFFTYGDPTHGYVEYVDQTTAQNHGLISVQNAAVYMGVDHTNVASGAGRASVRVTSKKSYNHGLVILDLAHMPGGVCGTWPAFWLVGPDWPLSGEVDIIEGVNSQASNDMTLHTGPGCSMSNNGNFSGTLMTPNCDVNAPGQNTNSGCQIATPNTQSYGADFNANFGGVYATEWTSESINIHFFPRGSIPDDISSGNPDPSTWGTALASFAGGGCVIDTFFKDQQIVFDTTFCGDWAGNVWSADATCSGQAPTCQSFVQNNPSAFADAYWSINSLKVYQSNGNASSPTPTWTSPASSSAIPVPATSVHSRSASQPPASSPLSASIPFSAPRFTASALPPTFFPEPTPASAPVDVQSPAVTPTTSAATSLVTAATDVAQQSPVETVSALQGGLAKEKRARNRRHLLEHQRRKALGLAYKHS